jgi:hypothetical protein
MCIFGQEPTMLVLHYPHGSVTSGSFRLRNRIIRIHGMGPDGRWRLLRPVQGFV